jgi:hypothetical protein
MTGAAVVSGGADVVDVATDSDVGCALEQESPNVARRREARAPKPQRRHIAGVFDVMNTPYQE